MAKIILFIGAPGSGKSSRGKICKQYGYVHISSSKLLKEAGYDLKTLKNIPNEVVLELIRKAIDSVDKSSTIILDGFPRNMEQLESIEKELEINHAIYLKISEKKALKRIENRIVCLNCGKSYSIGPYNHPKNEGICDDCGGLLRKRPEDNKEIFKKRYRNFRIFTYPVISYYSRQNKLVIIDASVPNEEIITLINSL